MQTASVNLCDNSQKLCKSSDLRRKAIDIFGWTHKISCTLRPVEDLISYFIFLFH